MKRLLLLIPCLVIIISISSFAICAINIKEQPNLKVFNNCNQIKLKDVPIKINNEVLLSDTDLLPIIGIRADTNNAIWDAKKKVLTLKSGKTTVIITMGSNKSKLNNKNIILNSTATIYENKRYLPVASIIHAFNKETALDNILPYFYIRSKVDFDNIKKVLDKSISSMNFLISYRMTENTTSTHINISNKTTYTFENTATTEIDRKNKIYFYQGETELLGTISKYYGYTVNKTSYTNSEYFGDGLGKWKADPITEKSFEDYLAGLDYCNSINTRNVLYAGLKLLTSPDNKSLLLKGNIFPLTKFEQNDKTYMKNYAINAKDGSIEIVIDKATNHITSFTKNFSYLDNATKQRDYNTLFSFDKFNAIKEIKLPNYIVEDQKKNKSTTGGAIEPKI